MKSSNLKLIDCADMRPVERKPNAAYRVREHLTESEMAKLLMALKANRHGHRDWLIGLLIYRHGLRVSENCDLRWDDLDLPKRTIAIRRLKGSIDSTHFLERDELAGLKRLQREQEPKAAYVFVNERGQPFERMGIARMIERAGEVAKLPFPVHVHMLRHSTGYAPRQHHQHGEVFRDVTGAVPRPLAVESNRGTQTSGNGHSIVRLWSPSPVNRPASETATW